MKKVLFVIIAAVLSVSTYAQGTFKLGVAGGFNMADIKADNFDSKPYNGFHAGLKAEIKLPVKLGFEGGALFSTKGAIYEGINDVGDKVDKTIQLTYVDLPVVMKIYSFKVLNFHLGPQISYLVGAKNDGTDIKDDLNVTDISAVFGLGLDVSKLHLAARYNLGLTELDESGAKNNVIQATLGLWIK